MSKFKTESDGNLTYAILRLIHNLLGRPISPKSYLGWFTMHAPLRIISFVCRVFKKKILQKKNNKQQKKKQNNKNTSSRKKAPGFNPYTLSECGAKYALAAVEPFNPLARGACVPLPPAVGSQKIMLFARFAVTIPAGATYGAVWLSPTIASDTYCAYYTSGTSSGYYDGTANWLKVANTANFSEVSFANCPYTRSQLYTTNPEVFGRIVSMGASIQCTSPSLYIGGTLVSFSSPTHENVAQLYSYDTLLSQATAIEQQMDKGLHWIATAGIEDKESVYSNDAETITDALFPFSNNVALDIPIGSSTTEFNGAPVMCFVINVPTNSTVAQTFNVQVVQHVEYSGKKTASLQTPTHVDVVGTSQVRTALTQINEMRAQNPKVNITAVFKEKLKKVIADGLKRVAIGGLTTLATELGGPGAGAMAAHFLSGR